MTDPLLSIPGPTAADLAHEDAVDTPATEIATETPSAVVDEARGADRPADVPDKFWDAEAGALRTDALLKSYLELERRLGAGGLDEEEGAGDEGDEAAMSPLDVPATPDDYEVDGASDLVAPDPEVNKRLHEAGFTQDQARLVYRLAEEYLLPAVSDAYGEVVVQQELGRLRDAFGGDEGWQATADQLQSWGQANLEPGVYATLASSYDGVMAMHAMMQAREPQVVHADAPAGPADESSLRRMMQDPRYWRDRDPAFVAEVTRGYERLFRQ